MDVTISPNRTCILLFILITILWTSPTTCQCPQMQSVGYTTPSGDIYVRYGNRLNVTCNLIKSFADTCGANASSMLYFKRNNERIPDEVVNVLNSTSIQLSFIPEKAADVNYYCYFKRSRETKDDLVCMNVVTVGVSPMPVEDFGCISHNWDNFTCSFTAPENYLKTDYNLSYTFKGKANRISFSCPELKEIEKGKFQCYWDIKTKPQYRQAQKTFWFMLHAKNRFGSITQNFTIEHFKWIKPNKPDHLKYINKTAHSITLNWWIPSTLNSFRPGLIHRIVYCVEYDKVWRLANIFKTEEGNGHSRNVTYTIDNLKYAHAIYDVRVSLKSAVAIGEADYLWSDNATITVTTDSDIPDCPPKTTKGCFEIDSSAGNLRNVVIYWQQINKEQENGQNFKYRLEVDYPHVEYNATTTYARIFNVPTREDIVINIWSQNEKGLSAEKSTIIIPSQRVSEPLNFIKSEHGEDVYELSWNHPINVDPMNPIVNYTIFWCESERDRPYLCESRLNWTVVPSDAERFNQTLPKPKYVYQFAIAANTQTSSSGMIWATCTLIQRGSPGQMKNVWINNVGSDFIEVAWKIICSDGIDVVKGFIIFYCPVISLSEAVCKEPEQNVTIEGDKNLQIGNVTHLKPYTTYRLSVAAKINDSHHSHLSEAKFNTTNGAAPSTPPLNVTVYNITESSISVQWSSPTVVNGVIEKFVIRYNNKTVDTDRNVTNFTLTDLVSYKNYSITIQACTVACSEPSPMQLVTTKIGNPGHIEKPVVSAIQNASMQIEWSQPDPPRGPINYYQLKFNEKYQDESNVIDMVNVTGEPKYKIDSCSSSGNYFISVRGVNIVGLQHKYGPWSDELEAQCNQYNSLIYIIIFVFMILFIFGLFIGLKKCYVTYKNMQNIEVKLPPGLDPINPWDMEKHPDIDIDHQSQADEALLLGKIAEVRSGDSSGCSSGHESITCSESPTQTSNSDSGTEQPSSLTDNNIRFRKNVSSKGYVLPDITWGSNTSPTSASPPSNYCVLGIDSSSNPSQTDPTSDSVTATSLPSPYVMAGDAFVKNSNPNYVPYIPTNNETKPTLMGNGYVVVGLNTKEY